MIPTEGEVCIGYDEVSRFDSNLVWLGQDSVQIKLVASEPGSLGLSLYFNLLEMCL